MNIVLSKRLGDYGLRFDRLVPRKGIIHEGEHEIKIYHHFSGEPAIWFKPVKEDEEDDPKGNPETIKWTTFHPLDERFLESINQEHTPDETLTEIFREFLKYCFLCCENQIAYAEKELATRVRWVVDTKRSGHFLDRIDEGLKKKMELKGITK